MIGPEAAPWLTEFAETDETVLRLLRRLRKVLSVERARLVGVQTELRRRATGKFGALAQQMFFAATG